MGARNRILETADRLFYQRGINATGIDLIIAEAGVAKATLYAHFESKEVLIAKYLDRVRVNFEVELKNEVEQSGGSYLTPFLLLERSLEGGGFFGCPFANALTELPQSALVAEQVNAYRDVIRDFFLNYAPERYVPTLMLIYDGAFASCKVSPDGQQVQTAIELVEKILQGASA